MKLMTFPGIHYYYNMTKDLNCEELLPWFALTTQGDLVGTGFQVIGRLPKPKHRNWFESFENLKQGIKVTAHFFLAFQLFFFEFRCNAKCFILEYSLLLTYLTISIRKVRRKKLFVDEITNVNATDRII